MTCLAGIIRPVLYAWSRPLAAVVCCCRLRLGGEQGKAGPMALSLFVP